MTSKTSGNSPPGWDWYRANTSPVARPVSVTFTKRGDPYLRALLVMGARSFLQRAYRESDPLSRWALALQQRRGYHRACVAIAAKNARIVYALLAKEAAAA